LRAVSSGASDKARVHGVRGAHLVLVVVSTRIDEQPPRVPSYLENLRVDILLTNPTQLLKLPRELVVQRVRSFSRRTPRCKWYTRASPVMAPTGYIPSRPIPRPLPHNCGHNRRPQPASCPLPFSTHAHPHAHTPSRCPSLCRRPINSAAADASLAAAAATNYRTLHTSTHVLTPARPHAPTPPTPPTATATAAVAAARSPSRPSTCRQQRVANDALPTLAPLSSGARRQDASAQVDTCFKALGSLGSRKRVFAP
jgi:hypothetical protein